MTTLQLQHRYKQTQTVSMSRVLLHIKTNILLNIIAIIMSCIITSFSTSSFANEFRDTSSQTYQINPKKKIATVIGAGLLNRIHIDFATIMEVVGDESKYSIHWSGDYRNLFIFPKVEAGETIEISFIMSGGIAQDFIFTVGDCPSRSIILQGADFTQKANSNSAKPSAIASREIQSEINQMLRAMRVGTKDKYYVRDTKRNISKTPKLLIKQTKSYRYKNLSGAVLLVQNRSKKPVKIEQADIQRIFHNGVAVYMNQRMILPKKSLQILVVTQGG
ncbi:MAG: type-F conjugative transfer system secretin TraK [Pseudomonadota bacterium]